MRFTGHIGILSILLTMSLCATVPQLINYQGKLTDTTGVGINDTLTMTFRIYDAQSGGAPLWTETHPNVPIVKGLFDTQLGSVTPLDLMFDTLYYLELEINSDTLAPRVTLVSAPYAFRALYADTALYAIAMDTASSGFYVWNQDTMAQPADLWITGTATVGTLIVDDVRGQGYTSVTYAGAPILVNSPSFVSLFTAVYNAGGAGSGVMVSFTGTFDDKADVGGAAMEIQLVRDPGPGETILSTQYNVMAIQDMFSQRSITLTAMDYPRADTISMVSSSWIVHSCECNRPL